MPNDEKPSLLDRLIAAQEAWRNFPKSLSDLLGDAVTEIEHLIQDVESRGRSIITAEARAALFEAALKNGCEGQELHDIGPLSWLRSTIEMLRAGPVAVTDTMDHDLGAYHTAIDELQGLHDRCFAALSTTEQAVEGGEAVDHLGAVLHLLANLEPDSRCRALENAQTFYNAVRPDAIIAPEPGFITTITHTTPLDILPAPQPRQHQERGPERRKRDLSRAHQERKRGHTNPPRGSGADRRSKKEGE